MAQERENEGGPPLGSAPGYGDLSEGVVGGQGMVGGQATSEPQQQPRPSEASKHDQARDAGDEQSQPGGNTEPDGKAPPNTPLLKEELLPEEKGTSLDEGGAG